MTSDQGAVSGPLSGCCMPEELPRSVEASVVSLVETAGIG